MITVTIDHDGVPIAKMRFDKTQVYGVHADYRVEVAVERLGREHAIGLSTVEVLVYNPLRWNVLALVKEALHKLDTEGLSLERDTRTSDLARKERGAFPEIQGWEG